MKRTLSFTCLFCFSFVITSIAQLPDLIVNSSSLQTTDLSVGDYLQFSFRVKNIGTVNAAKCHTKIYVSTSSSTNNAILLSDVSCEALSANQETDSIKYIFPLPYNVAAGNWYVIMSVDSRNEVIESNENNIYSSNTPLTVNTISSGQQNLPYPIILIHGLNSEYRTWDTLKNDLQNYYGWSYGGNMNFCLNQDGDLSKSNKNNDYKDWTDTTALTAADFYTINFNVGVNGSEVSATNPTVESNQSSIVKQGLAVRDAIMHVLKLTGRDKVILLTHSMGGLASREYLQNAVNWQTDGKHHVAKLATLGTPHGGSNSSGWGFSGIVGIDEHSEAVRDLRYSYFYSGADGVYLFGGKESNSAMWNFLFTNYNNIDVNANGTVDSKKIVGLNEKNIPNDLPYSCVIGDGSILGGDGVVDADRADINNYYNLSADTFICVAQSTIWHTELPKQTDFIIKGLDEPKHKNFAYQIDTGKYYFGNFSAQSLASSATADSDYYKFLIPENGDLTVELLNIPVSNAGIKILDTTNNIVSNLLSNSKSNLLQTSIPVSAGDHYLNLFATPDIDAWYYPYAVKINFNGYGICPLSNIVFAAGMVGVNYQWQVDSGQGFINIIDDGIIAGALTDSIQLTQPPTSWYGYKYRCVMNGNTFSAEKKLKFSVRWTGVFDRAWENPVNWNCGVLPDADTDVIINDGVPNYPVINTDVSCRSLKIKPNASVTVKDKASLIITGKD